MRFMGLVRRSERPRDQPDKRWASRVLCSFLFGQLSNRRFNADVCMLPMTFQNQAPNCQTAALLLG
jgi:hypothetical protein